MSGLLMNPSNLKQGKTFGKIPVFNLIISTNCKQYFIHVTTLKVQIGNTSLRASWQYL